MYSSCLSSQLYGHGRSSASSCCNPLLFTICFCFDFYCLLYDCFHSFFAAGPARNCVPNGSRSTVAIISRFRHSWKKMLDRHDQTFLFMLIESAHEGSRMVLPRLQPEVFPASFLCVSQKKESQGCVRTQLEGLLFCLGPSACT